MKYAGRAAAVVGLGLIGALLSVYQLSSPSGGGGALAGPPAPSLPAAVGSPLGGRAGLSKLKRLEPALYQVEEKYVQPSRVDWERMFVAGLEGVEGRVPVIAFDRFDEQLDVVIGQHRERLAVPTIGSNRMLQAELRRVMLLVERHLDPAQVPLRGERGDPFAEVEYALVNGVLSTLDPHTMLIPPDDARDMDVENKGHFGGLGVTIVEEDGWLVIEHPSRDGPAYAAGVRARDRVVRIDGESTLNMTIDESIERLRGDVGSPVTLSVERPGASLDIRVVRRTIKVHEVRSQLLDGRVGYVNIETFHLQVEADLHAHLARMRREAGGELRGLVLDLRGNPGGYLSQAVAVADTFLGAGTIVTTVDRHGVTQERELAHARNTEPAYPVVVLVDSNSASASEIVAGALRNNERAVIVGERTFGKGSVQNLYPFADESKLKITISKYLTPGERSIQSIGIPADILVQPVVAERRAPGLGVNASGAGEPVALVYWRERVRREADLNQHLEEAVTWADEPVYRVPFLRAYDRPRSYDVVDRKDFIVEFARDLVLVSPSGRRGEMLGAAGSLVANHIVSSDRAIVSAFGALDIDWRNGPAAPAGDGKVRVQVRVGDDGVARAGQRTPVVVDVTNTSTQPLFRVGAIGQGSDLLGGHELFFGRLAPGETRSWTTYIDVVPGWPTEAVAVPLSIRDAGGEIGVSTVMVQVVGTPPPRFAWTWTLDDATHGNGDGVPASGERIALHLMVENVGEGPSVAAYARLRNRSRRALDIVAGTGTLEIGALEPSSSWSGTFLVDLGSPHEGAWNLALELGDARAYDVASTTRGGFWEYETHADRVSLSPALALPKLERREPPAITVYEAPDVVVEAGLSSFAGRVVDDGELSHVVIYQDGNKLQIDLPTGSRSEFRVAPYLKPGANLLTVVATDASGLVSTRSVVTRAEDATLQASLSGPQRP